MQDVWLMKAYSWIITLMTYIPIFVFTEKSHHIREWIAYDFWTFLLLKLVLSFFVVGVLCSTFGGCATKVYKKYKYKQLKWTDNDEDRILTDDGDDHGRGDVSRCTSVTLMSFDHSYWKRLRLLRLKYFLLKPKPLNRKIARIKSYPTTPTHHHAHPNNNNNLLTDGVGDAGAGGSSSSGNKVKSTVVESCAMPNERMMTMMLLANKQQSLSESELERKCNKFVSAHQRRTTTAHKIGCPANRKDVSSINDGHRDHGSDEDDDDDDDEVTHWSPSHYIIQDMSKTRGFSDAEEVEGVGGAADEEQGEKYKLITRVQPPPPPTTTISNKASSVSVRKGRPAFISVTMPEQEQGRGINAKSRKEQENFKRRQWSEEEQKSLGGSSSSGCSGSSRKKKFARKLQQNNYNCQQAPSSTEEVAMKLILQQQRDKGKSQISVATIHSLARLSSSGEMTDSQDRVDMDDADHDFEMDYYDYDVLNAGNIPGSYLGLEPAFVLWNSEMYPDKEDGEEDDDEEEEEEEEEDSSFIQEIPSSELNGGSSSETFSISNNYGLSPSYSSPHPLHNNSQSSQQRTTQRGVRESSLQTLKFVDDDDVDDIDEFEDFHDDRDTQVTLLSDKNRSGCPV